VATAWLARSELQKPSRSWQQAAAVDAKNNNQNNDNRNENNNNSKQQQQQQQRQSWQPLAIHHSPVSQT